MNCFTDYDVAYFLETICTVNYCFFEEKSKLVRSNEYYARYLFERALVWLRKLIDKKDLLENEVFLALF